MVKRSALCRPHGCHAMTGSRTHRGPGPLVTGKRVLLVLGLWLLATVVIGTATVFAARSSGAADVTAIVVGEVYTLLIVALLIVFRPHTAQALGLVRCRRVDVALAFAACGGAYLIAAAIQSAVGPWPWSSAITILKAMGSDDGRLATAGPAVAGIIVIRACVLASLAEETLFRGVLYTWLRQRFPASAAIPDSASAHAAIHGFPAILPLAFILGLGFGWVRERSGSALPTVIVHAVHNAADRVGVLRHRLDGAATDVGRLVSDGNLGEQRTDARPGQSLRGAPDDRTDRKVPQLQHREPGEHVELAEGAWYEPHAGNSHYAAPLEQLAHARQRVAEPLPNSLSDDVSCQEKLGARRDRHGDKQGRRP
jgi:membrane protease YdiL (CAAX protease family)